MNPLFSPIHYRPIPAKVLDLRTPRKSLDGTWRINIHPAPETFTESPAAAGWGDFNVPGQWTQQGYVSSEGGILPPSYFGHYTNTKKSTKDQAPSVVVARQFTIPASWADCRIFLRFDAIHGGTHYHLNGAYLGYSENLFTPVEWEITDAARPGQTNLLYLGMKVKTVSEALSHASDYVSHNLGGIDRSVSIYALPKVHISEMRIEADLDSEYHDGELRLKLVLDNAPQKLTVARASRTCAPKTVAWASCPCVAEEKSPPSFPNLTPCGNLSIEISLKDPEGKTTTLSTNSVKIASFSSKQKSISLNARVPTPLKWNAEQPHLYSLTIDLKQAGNTLERIERKIGFRKVEVRGSQLYVNGVRVKLAGSCRHEVDPLTGRADTMRHAERDVQLHKGANLNYIRTSHYPPTQELLDAADRLGMYVQVEGPFHWIRAGDPSDEGNLLHVLNPTSAMVDYHHAHPSVIMWSIANESIFYKAFEEANSLCKKLDPTRPTIFNGIEGTDDPKRLCDITNGHYPLMPYDEYLKDDPRPLLLGEYFFPACHERTDVAINPGLREAWGHGHAEPDSEWGRQCAEGFDQPPKIRPGAKPGFWNHIIQSERMVGGAIFASVDDIFFFSEGRSCGCAQGLWGLFDGWRREKPEWFFSKLIFSPVWFPSRDVPFSQGQGAVRVPVENRYSFTNLRDLKFEYQIVRCRSLDPADQPDPSDWPSQSRKKLLKANLPSLSQGQIEIPVPKGTKEGDKIVLRVTDHSGNLVNIVPIQLGKQKPRQLPEPTDGNLELRQTGKNSVIKGNGFSLVFDRPTGDFDAASPDHQATVIAFPVLHITRFDFGVLKGINHPGHAVFPDTATRVLESATVSKSRKGIEIAIHDRYENFSGSIRWLIDANGMGRINYDYIYSGEEMDTREMGVRLLLPPECDEVRWRRWSEWGDVFPQDHMSRTEGVAKPRRAKRWGKEEWNKRPEWPWALDQTELGTNDFRSMKYHVCEASLQSPDRKGIRIHANADAHVRPALSGEGVQIHILSQCRLTQIVLKPGDRIQGCYAVEILR